MNNPPFPSFSFENENSELIDDKDDCIICKKLLLDHTEEDTNECYATLVKKQSRKNSEET